MHNDGHYVADSYPNHRSESSRSETSSAAPAAVYLCSSGNEQECEGPAVDKEEFVIKNITPAEDSATMAAAVVDPHVRHRIDLATAKLKTFDFDNFLCNENGQNNVSEMGIDSNIDQTRYTGERLPSRSHIKFCT